MEDNDDSWTDVNLNEDGDLVATARIKDRGEESRNLHNISQSQGKGEFVILKLIKLVLIFWCF